MNSISSLIVCCFRLPLSPLIVLCLRFVVGGKNLKVIDWVGCELCGPDRMLLRNRLNKKARGTGSVAYLFYEFKLIAYCLMHSLASIAADCFMPSFCIRGKEFKGHSLGGV